MQSVLNQLLIILPWTLERLTADFALDFVFIPFWIEKKYTENTGFHAWLLVVVKHLQNHNKTLQTTKSNILFF